MSSTTRSGRPTRVSRNSGGLGASAASVADTPLYARGKNRRSSGGNHGTKRSRSLNSNTLTRDVRKFVKVVRPPSGKGNFLSMNSSYKPIGFCVPQWIPETELTPEERIKYNASKQANTPTTAINTSNDCNYDTVEANVSEAVTTTALNETTTTISAATTTAIAPSVEGLLQHEETNSAGRQTSMDNVSSSAAIDETTAFTSQDADVVQSLDTITNNNSTTENNTLLMESSQHEPKEIQQCHDAPAVTEESTTKNSCENTTTHSGSVPTNNSNYENSQTINELE